MMWNALIAAIILALLPYIVGGIASAIIVIYALIETIKNAIKQNKRINDKKK